MFNYLRSKKRLIYVFTSLLFLFVVSFFYENKVSYVRFVDEEEDMVTARYLLKGKKLYKDIFANHQPVSYVISAGIQKITNPSSIFLLIKRHREFIIFWSIVWSLILVSSFGFWVMPFIFVYEISKIFLLGNLFLAESLVVYPIAFLTGKLLTSNKRFSLKEIFFAGIIFSLSFFLLAPVWPLLLFLGLLFLIRLKKNELLKSIFLFILGFLIPVLVISSFMYFPGYLKDVFEFNSKYFIPFNQEQLSLQSIPKSFFSFVFPFLPGFPNTSFALITKILSFFSITGLIFLLAKRKFKLFLIAFVILGLANIRFIKPGQDYYRRFHILIWFSEQILLLSFIFTELISSLKRNVKTLLILSIFIALVSVFLISKNELFIKRNVLNDYYINYSKQVDLGEAVKILKNEKDTLFVVPDESLIFWQADILPSSRYVFFYEFMAKIHPVATEIDKMFKENPPTFYYCRSEDKNLFEYTKDYQEILKDGKGTNLYILKKRIKGIEKEQKQKLDFYRFEI